MNEQQDKAEMAIITKRPVKLVRTLRTSEGVLVAVRLPSGEDAHVPLPVLFSLFWKYDDEGEEARKREAMHARIHQ